MIFYYKLPLSNVSGPSYKLNVSLIFVGYTMTQFLQIKGKVQDPILKYHNVSQCDISNLNCTQIFSKINYYLVYRMQ